MLPPFAGVAVNVTEAPDGVGLVPDVMAVEIEGVTDEEMLITISLLVAVTGLAQDKLEAITQLTICPFVSEPFE